MRCTMSKETEKLLKCFENGLLSIGETVAALHRVVNQETEQEQETGEHFRREQAVYKAAFVRLLKEIRARERREKQGNR